MGGAARGPLWWVVVSFLEIAVSQQIHLTINTELEPGKCPGCGGPTVLLVAPCGEWHIDQDEGPAGEEYLDLGVEFTGHYCRDCDDFSSFSINR